MKNKIKSLNKIGLFLLIAFSSLLLINTNLVKANESETHEPVAVSNGWIEHGASQTTIPGWKMYGTYDVNLGSGSQRTFNIGSGRKSLNNFSHAEFDESSNGLGNFTSYLKRKTDSPRGFFALAQTFSGLETDQTYTFRVEVEGNAMFQILAYNGIATSGANDLGVSTKRSITSGRDVFEFSFRPTSSTATLSLRHYFNVVQDTRYTVKSVFLGKEIAPDLLSMREQVKEDAINGIISKYNLDYDFYLEEMPSLIFNAVLDEVLKINHLNYQNINVITATTSLINKVEDIIEADIPNALNRKLNILLSDELLLDEIYDEVKDAVRLHLNDLETNLEKSEFVDLIEDRILNKDLAYEFELVEDPTWSLEGKVEGLTNLFPEHTLNLTIPKLDDDEYYDKVDLSEFKGEFTIINNEYNLDKTTFVNYSTPVYYVKDSGLGGNNNNDGTFESPLASVSVARDKMSKGVIVITSHLPFSGTVAIGNGKDILITSSNVDIEKDVPTEFYDMYRTSSTSAASFSLSGTGKLTLENVTLIGYRTTSSEALIYMTGGELVINDGTLITGGTRDGGGGAIRLSGATNPVVTMNGGEISGNFFTIATYNASNLRFNFFGGKMINNTTANNDDQVMNITGTYTIGGDFVFKDNYRTNGSLEGNGRIGTNSHVRIREDFTGEVNFNGNHATYGTQFTNFNIVDMEGNIITDYEPVEFLGIRPVNDKYLHLVYTDEGKFIWDYTYEEQRVVIKEPTVESEGIYAKRAIIGEDEYSNTIYIDAIILPKLSVEDYYFEYDSFNQIITYTHKNLDLEFFIDVDLDDENFISEITLVPTLEGKGLLLTTNPLYPGLEFEYSLPKIDSEDYIITTSNNDINNLELTYEIELNNPHQDSSFVVDVLFSDFDDFEVTENPLIDAAGIVAGTSNLYPNAILELALQAFSDESFYEREIIDLFYDIYTSTNNPYGLDLEFVHYKADIFYIHAKDGDDDNPGTFEEPMANLRPVITKISTSRPAIVVYIADFLLIKKEVNYVFDNKTVKIISSNVDIQKGVPTETYRVSLATDHDGSLFSVTNGGYLELENIVLDGGRGAGNAASGATIDVKENSTLVINDGTVIKNGNRASGGSAIFITSNSKLIMNGGLITENYSDTKSAAIGINTDNGSVEIHLLGGAITKTTNIIRFCENNNIDIISFEDEIYPKEKMDLIPLKHRPIILYALGDVSLLKEEGIAIIGSRETDEEYFKIGIELGKKLSKKYVINSGLALGSDTSAHQGAMMGTRKTIAVLANGFNTIYPAANKELAADIAKKGGLLITEYPPFSQIRPYFFADRDRLQAALSKGTIVVQTGIKSGTMITVKYTRDYYKHLFVVEPLDDGNKYNDEGNYKLLEDEKTNPINLNTSLKEIENILTINLQPKTKIVTKKFVWKVVSDLFSTSYQLGNNKPIETIPKEYTVIKKTDTEVITTKEVEVPND